MKALIDSDIFQFEFGSATDSEYKPISWPFIQARIQGRIDKIMNETGADEYQLYITSDDKSNFRYDIATIKPYKGHRPSEKPFWYNHIRNFLVDFRGAIEVFGQEADDAISIEQYKNLNYVKQVDQYDYEAGKLEKYGCKTIICSRDKDLRMVPGWHYEWGVGNSKSAGPYFVSEVEGLHSFYCQLLTGDPTDNIPGLYGVGKSSALLGRVRECDSELDMYKIVQEQYEKRFGSYWEAFLKENARLLWMRREEDEIWEPPISTEELREIQDAAAQRARDNVLQIHEMGGHEN